MLEFEGILTAQVWISLLTLTLMEIVLGIDNIVFLSILADRLPESQQGRARKIGLILALVGRLGLLLAIGWIMRLTETLFTVPVIDHPFSGKHLILLGGGLFLIGKATHEIYHKLEGGTEESGGSKAGTTFGMVLFQILLMDMVFSLDSVITAVGMAEQIWVMATAMIIAVGVMLIFANRISAFVNRHPSMKILALSFLVLIGVMLMVEGWGGHMSKGYVYFAMAFSLAVELLNMRFRKKHKPVKLWSSMTPTA